MINFEQKHMNILLISMILVSLILVCYKCLINPFTERFVSEINNESSVCGKEKKKKVYQEFTNETPINYAYSFRKNFGSITGLDTCMNNLYPINNGSSSNCSRPLEKRTVSESYLKKNDTDYFVKEKPLKLKNISEPDNCNKCEIRKEVFDNLQSNGHLESVNPAAFL